MVVKGTKSIRRISHEVFSAPECNSMYNYLKDSNWIDELINNNRTSFLGLFFNNEIKHKKLDSFIIDDTVNPKKKANCIEGLSYNHSHTEGKRIKFHCFVSSQFVCGDISMFLDYKL